MAIKNFTDNNNPNNPVYMQTDIQKDRVEIYCEALLSLDSIEMSLTKDQALDLAKTILENLEIKD